MKHFKLREDLSIDLFGRKLFRIECIKEIKNKNVKIGDLGGYVEKESNLSGNAWVSDNARVLGDAKVFDNAWIYQNARVSDDAIVSGNATVCNNAMVFGDAKVFDNAMVFGNAIVFGEVDVFGDAKVFDNAMVFGDAKVFGDTHIFGNSNVCCDKIQKRYDVCNITNTPYNITITPKHIRIGYQHYSKTDWFKFKDSEIEKIEDKRFLDFWKKWKPILKEICNEKIEEMENE